MIDHISIAVRDLGAAEGFYAAILAPLGLTKLREWPGVTVGFGKKYPEFWINRRDALERIADDSGVHICLRAPDITAVDAFHTAALKGGGTSDGEPGLRPHYYAGYYAAFIRDPDGNRIEAVTFVREGLLTPDRHCQIKPGDDANSQPFRGHRHLLLRFGDCARRLAQLRQDIL